MGFPYRNPFPAFKEAIEASTGRAQPDRRPQWRAITGTSTVEGSVIRTYTAPDIIAAVASVRTGEATEDLHRSQHLALLECPNPACRMWRELFPLTASKPHLPALTTLEFSLLAQRLQRLLGTAIDASNRVGRPALTDPQLDSLEAVTAALFHAEAATEVAITTLTHTGSARRYTDARSEI